MTVILSGAKNLICHLVGSRFFAPLRMTTLLLVASDSDFQTDFYDPTGFFTTCSTARSNSSLPDLGTTARMQLFKFSRSSRVMSLAVKITIGTGRDGGCSRKR